MNTKLTDNLKFLSVHDLAKILKLSETAIYRIISGRKIPFYKLGHVIRFKEQDVLKYLENSRVEQMDYR